MGMLTYIIENKLYINVTNNCTNNCTFCIRNTPKGLGDGYELWLEDEPTSEQIIDELKKMDLNKFAEIVFCGYGEPLLRYDVVLEVAEWIKKNYALPIRVNTNGHASYIFNKNIPQLLSKYIDKISISLNAPNKEIYNKICAPVYEDIYDHIIEFIKESKKYIKEVYVSVLDILNNEEIEECRKIADKLGVKFRLRYFEQ